MPIKVRCKHCETVLTVSDKARGRAIKCKECGGRVQVGSGKRKARPQKSRPKKGGPPPHPDDLFGGLDLNAAADDDRRICPSCTTAVVDEEAVVCPKCGVDLDTGKLSAKEKQRRSRNAPPPEEFYKDVWGNSWQFLKENMGWAVRTALVWAITGTMAICSVFTLNWYIDGRTDELLNSGQGMIEVTEDGALIDLEDNDDGWAIYDGTRYTKSAVNEDGTLSFPPPRIGAIQSPPSLFWGMILLISVLGFGGWAWTLTVQIIQTTMAKEKTIKRFNTDLFAAMAMGCRSIFWPAILMWPFLIVPLLIMLITNSEIGAGIALGCIYFVPVVLFLPAGLVHLTQKYTYRAWLLDFMSKDFAKTAAPSLYVSMLSLLMVLWVPLSCLVVVAAFSGSIYDFYVTQVEYPLLSSILDYDPEDGVYAFTFTIFRLPIAGMIAFIGSFVVFGLLAFPAVFIMRVYGLFGYYFRPELSLINEQTQGERVGFGPRFLAFQIDAILMLGMTGVSWFLAGNSLGLFGYLYDFGAFMTLVLSLVMWVLFSLSTWGIYFRTWESGQNRATLGKASMGIMILTNDDKPMTPKQATGRYAAAMVTCLTLFAGFVMCAFHPKKSALHDIISKSKVVWRGEGEEA